MKFPALNTKYFILHTLLAFIMASSFLFLLPSAAFAANLYWVGTDGAATNVASNWKTTDPATCGSGDAGAAPGASDVAIFDPDCDNGAAVTTSFSVLGVSMVSGYTGTVTQNAISMTIGASGWTQAGGTFTGNSDGSTATITDSGILTISGGVFTSTNDTLTLSGDLTFSGATFTHNSGSVTFNSSTSARSHSGTLTLNNATLLANGGCGASTIAWASGVLTVDGTLTINNNTTCGGGSVPLTLDGPGSISAKGDLAIDGLTATAISFSTGSLVITANGTGTQTITGDTNGGGFPSLTIDKATGTLNLASTIYITKNLTYVQGTVAPGTSTILFYFTDITPTITGSLSLTNVTFQSFRGDCTADTIAIASGTTLTVTGTLTVTNSASCGGGAFGFTLNGPGGISAQGDVTVGAGGFSTSQAAGDGVITINGTGTQTLTGTTNGTLPNVVIDKSSGTLNLASTIKISGNLTNTQGTISPGTSTIQMNSHGQGTVTGSMSLTNLAFFANGTCSTETNTIASGTTLTLTGNLTFTNSSGCGGGSNAATVNGPGTITVQGDITNTKTGSNTHGYGGDIALTLTGTNSQSITKDGSAFSTGTVTINKTSGTVTLATALALSGSGQDLLVASGSNFTLAGAFTLTVADVTTISGTLNQTTATIATGSTGSILVTGGGVWNNSSTGDITVGSGGVTNSGQINFGTLATCGASDNIAITSTSGGTARTWTGNGSYDWYDVAVTDLTDQKSAITAWSSTNNGNNTNIHILSGCPTPPVSNWHFDEGQGTTTSDSAPTAATGTLAGATLPTWQTEDQCVLGKCLYFDGTSSKVTVASSVPTVSSIGFWVRPTAVATLGLIDLDGGTTKIVTDSSGVISATGFTSPTIYINGRVATTLVANRWQYVEVTTGTAITASAIKIGTDNTNFTKGFFDEVSLFTYARSAAQVKVDYNLGAANVLGANTQNLPDALSDGLVGYWKMDESSWTSNCSTEEVIDSSGNGNNGESCPTGAANDPVAGKFGNAGSFDGSNDYVSVDDANSLDMGTGSFTVSAWVKPGSTANGRLAHKINASNVGWVLDINTNTAGTVQAGFVRIVVRNGTNISYGADGSLGTGSWKLITATINRSSNELKLFVNGTQIGSTQDISTLTTSLDNAQALQIGGSTLTGSFYVNGSIDETRIYNRALSGAEVSQLYNWAPGPVGYWKMDGESGIAGGSTIPDSSGNGLNGTLGVSAELTNAKYGKGLLVDTQSSNKSITVADNSILEPTGAITVGAWYKPSSVTNQNRFIISKGSAYHLLQSQSSTGCSAASICFRLTIGGVNYSANYAVSNLSVNQWYYFSGTYDGSSVKLYSNGILVNTTTASGSIDTSTDPFCIGDSSISGDCTNSNNMVGTADDVKVYNYARTPGQVLEDMNAGHPAPGSPVSSAVGHWKFDEGYGTTANNRGNGGSALNATLTNFDSPAVATSGWHNDGKFGKALEMNGGTDLIDVGSPTAVDDLQALTITTWVNLDGMGGSGLGRIADKGSAGAGWWQFYMGGNDLSFQVDHATTDLNVNTNGDKLTALVGSWHHIAVTWDGSSTATNVSIYIDGQLHANSGPVNGVGARVSDAANNLIIGNRAAGDRGVDGTLDEFKLYNQVLTADQIKLDMNKSQAQVLGSTGDKTGTGYESKTSENQKYCVPGDASTCTAPVLQYDFNEGTGTTVADSSGTGNYAAGNIIPGSGGAWVNGKSDGKAYSFDALSTHIFAGSGTTLDNLGASGGMTAEAWIYPKSRGENNNAFILTKNAGNSQATGGWLFLINGISGNQAGLEFVVDGSTDLVRDTAATTITLNQWNHVVVSWNGVMTTASTARIFINGKEATYTGTTNGASRPDDGASSLYIGNASSLDRTFDGYIDQVKVFNYNRTPAQIAYDYNQGKPIAHWKMDECQGTTLNDSSGNGNTGTLTIGATGGNTTAGTCQTSGAWFDGVTGKRNNSMDFDGTDDSAVSASIDLTGTNAVTASFWLNWNAYAANDDLAMELSSNSNIITTGFFINPNSSATCSGQVEVDIKGNAGDNTACFARPSAGTWHHWTIVMDKGAAGATEITPYIDGILVTYTKIASPNSTNNFGNHPLYLMSRGGASLFGAGLMDDAKIFNYPLTPTQIKTLYNEGAYRVGPATGAP